MNKSLYDNFIEKYPSQFKQIKYPGCGEGWLDILDKACSLIKWHIDNKNRQGTSIDFNWTQIKEKFGSMRAYYAGGDDFIHGVVSMLELTSSIICEYSGNKGKLRKQRVGDDGEPVPAWMKTLSDIEAKKDGYI